MAKGGKSLVLFGTLVRAVKRESAQAVAFWWGVDTQTVLAWRQALSVRSPTEGDRRLRRAFAAMPWWKDAQRKAWAKNNDSARCEKIAAAKAGQTAPTMGHRSDAAQQSRPQAIGRIAPQNE
jgi:hypothetical protein